MLHSSLPRTRGYARASLCGRARRRLSPAYAGVCRSCPRRSSPHRPLSRVRGGMPGHLSGTRKPPNSLPRTRGYAHHPGPAVPRRLLSPAYAGVCPPPPTGSASGAPLSRVRGGMPRMDARASVRTLSLPRTRGYAPVARRAVGGRELSPAYAGVCPPRLTASVTATSLSRVRGGMPSAAVFTAPPNPSLPRTRGYALLLQPARRLLHRSPAYAGVCRTGSARPTRRRTLSRVRGGMPAKPVRRFLSLTSLPRTRGYAGACPGQRNGGALSPAYAGVCPPSSPSSSPWTALSRVRGGMPGHQPHCRPKLRLSPAYAGVCPPRTPPPPSRWRSLPRTRGYAPHDHHPGLRPHLSPAYAGVCRGGRRPRRSRGSLPRVRGGMPVDPQLHLHTDDSLPRTRGHVPDGRQGALAGPLSLG